MTMLEILKTKNPNIEFYSVNDKKFESFGRILYLSEYKEFLEYLNNKTEVPIEGNKYVAHDEDLYKSIKNHSIYNHVFGSIRLQYGFVNGHNTKMNSLEYHKSSEINIAASPLVLLLGRVSEIKDNQYDVNKLIAFYVPENTAIEIYPNILHFSPCKVKESGFKCGVVLPYGTNVDFCKIEKPVYDEDLYLLKTNKWLLNHKDNKRFADLGAYEGLIGNNIEIIY